MRKLATERVCGFLVVLIGLSSLLSKIFVVHRDYVSACNLRNLLHVTYVYAVFVGNVQFPDEDLAVIIGIPMLQYTDVLL